MKRICLICITILLFSGAQAVASKHIEIHNMSILVTQDFTEVLGKALTANTSIEVVRAIPADYTPDVHTYYLKKYWQKFAELAQNATGVITVASTWPEDPLYPWARRANIRIVNIDAIAPLDKSRAGVPVLDLTTNPGKTPAVWNSPGNTARIADIVASDLKMLFPEESDQIQTNLNNLKKTLFKLRSRFETAFGMVDFFEVVALSLNHAYLTEEFGIVVVDSLIKPGTEVTREEIINLVNSAKSSDVQVVLCGREPKNELRNLLISQGFKIIVLNNFSYDANKTAYDQLLTFHEQNLALLLKGLSANP